MSLKYPLADNLRIRPAPSMNAMDIQNLPTSQQQYFIRLHDWSKQVEQSIRQIEQAVKELQSK